MSTKPQRQPVNLRVLVPSTNKARQAPAAVPLAPQLTLAGSTTHFKIFFDNSLGTFGQTLANAMLATCEQDYARLKEYFAVDPDNLPFTVQIVPVTPGHGGGSHSGTAVTVNVGTGASDDQGRFILLAEVDESFMEKQSAGWDDAGSNGEGLSRVLATEPYPGSLGNFATSSFWLDHGRPDWVTQTENTDANPISTGCAVLFLYFLRFQLGFSWKQIVRAGKSTLADTYRNLTGRNNGFQRFEELVQRRFPQVPGADLQQDNPFPLQSDILSYDPATGDKSVFLADVLGTMPRQLPKAYDGWRSSWSSIVSGNFGSNSYSDLFFYDSSAGVGEFYIADGTGNITELNSNCGLRNTWSIVLAGKFLNSNYSSLFFYDPTTNQCQFSATDGHGNMNDSPAFTFPDPTPWTMVITGNFTNSNYADLLFYDATTGRGALYTADGSGGLHLIQQYQGWRPTWKLIVPGRFTGANRDDLLFYDPTMGEGEFHSFDSSHNLPLANSYTGWRKSWSAIVPGNFAGGSRTSLLFYDPATGDEEVYTFKNAAVMSDPLKTNNWRETWSLLVPGNFAGNNLSEILLYDAAAGAGEIWSTDGHGGFSVLKSFGGRRRTWTKVIPGNFTGGDYTSVLLYDAGVGAAELYATDGLGNLGFPVKAYSDWRRSWSQIVAGRFTDSKYDSFLFYDQAAGTGQFYTTDGKGNIKLLSSYTDWRKSWTIIVAGKFTHSEYTDLLFYEGSTGAVELHTVDGTGGMPLVNPPSMPLNFGPGWEQIVVGNLTGQPLQDLFLYKRNPPGHFGAIPGGSGVLLTTDGKGAFTPQNTYTNQFDAWTQISRGNYGGIVFFQDSLVQFAKIDQNGNVIVQQSFGGVFPLTAILTAGAFS
jgi:hypothetical protein